MPIPSSDQLDLREYRTQELVEEILELLRIEESVKTVLKVLVVSLLATWICGPLLIPAMQDGYWAWVWLIWGGLTGAFVGIILAPAHLAKRALGGMIRILQLLADTLRVVVRDMSSVDSGEKTLPDAGSLIHAGYRDIILPTVEDVIGETLGLLKHPVLWIYNHTFGRVIRYTLAMLPFEEFEDRSKNARREDRFAKTFKDVAANADKLEDSLQVFRDLLGNFGSKSLRLFIVPSYVLAGVVILISTTAFLLTHHFID